MVVRERIFPHAKAVQTAQSYVIDATIFLLTRSTFLQFENAKINKKNETTKRSNIFILLMFQDFAVVNQNCSNCKKNNLNLDSV